MYRSTYLCKFCDHRAFMSLESCSKVWSTAGKSRHAPLRQSQPRAWLFSSFTSSWPLSPMASSQKFQLDPGAQIYTAVVYTTRPRDKNINNVRRTYKHKVPDEISYFDCGQAVAFAVGTRPWSRASRLVEHTLTDACVLPEYQTASRYDTSSILSTNLSSSSTYNTL